MIITVVLSKLAVTMLFLGKGFQQLLFDTNIFYTNMTLRCYEL